VKEKTPKIVVTSLWIRVAEFLAGAFLLYFTFVLVLMFLLQRQPASFIYVSF
jgi:hypothetical protein